MDSNPINEGISSGRIESSEDVEGHGIRGAAIDGPDTDDHGDVEGHMPFKRFDDETVEGHGFSIKGLVEDDSHNQDTEGHARFGGGLVGDDDTEGHASKFGGLVADDQDVEGHMPRIKILDAEEPSDETVEGHLIKGRLVEDDQDVEGHMPIKRILETEPADDESVVGDDTEGHGARFTGLTDTDDVEGHATRVKVIETPEPSGEDGDDAEGHGVRIKI